MEDSMSAKKRFSTSFAPLALALTTTFFLNTAHSSTEVVLNSETQTVTASEDLVLVRNTETPKKVKLRVLHAEEKCADDDNVLFNGSYTKYECNKTEPTGNDVYSYLLLSFKGKADEKEGERFTVEVQYNAYAEAIPEVASVDGKRTVKSKGFRMGRAVYEDGTTGAGPYYRFELR
jgi:hypothetical protein